jgi:hypothetical protein
MATAGGIHPAALAGLPWRARLVAAWEPERRHSASCRTTATLRARWGLRWISATSLRYGDAVRVPRRRSRVAGVASSTIHRVLAPAATGR